MTMATHFTDILDPEYGPRIRVSSPNPDPLKENSRARIRTPAPPTEQCTIKREAALCIALTLIVPGTGQLNIPYVSP